MCLMQSWTSPFDTTVLPAMLYVSESWATTKKLWHRSDKKNPYWGYHCNVNSGAGLF